MIRIIQISDRERLKFYTRDETTDVAFIKRNRFMDTDTRIADCLHRFSRVLLSNFTDILSELRNSSLQYTHIEEKHNKPSRRQIEHPARKKCK